MRNLLTFARLLSGLLLLILAAIIAYWVMQLAAPRPAIAPSGTLGEAATTRSLSSAAQAFGRPQAALPVAAAPSNIQVFGVAESGENGVAILAVDGKPAAAFAVGSKVDDSTRLVSALDGRIVLEQNGRRIEVKAPPRPSLAVLTSGAARPGEPGQVSTVPPVPTRPGGFNPPPRGVPPPGAAPPPVYSPPPAYTPPPQAPTPIANQAPPPMPQGQPPQQDFSSMPPNPDATQPAYPQYVPPQFDAPQFNPQTGQTVPGVVTPGVPLPTQSPGNPAVAPMNLPNQ